jgi:hypothetical protein
MDKWSELLVSYDETEVQLIKNILDAENIPVVIDSLKIRPYPVNIGKIGEIRIMVREEDLKKAQEVLKIMKNLSENS